MNLLRLSTDKNSSAKLAPPAVIIDYAEGLRFQQIWYQNFNISQKNHESELLNGKFRIDSRFETRQNPEKNRTKNYSPTRLILFLCNVTSHPII